MPRWLHPVANVAAASCRSRSGEGEVMRSPSARAPNQRSSASEAGGEVHGDFGTRWQAAASGGGSAHNLTPLVGRGARGERTVARVDSPFRSRRGVVGRMGVKRPEMGSKRRFLGEYATWPITAQPLFENTVMSRVTVHPSPERNRRNLIEHINLRRRHRAANSGPQPANVASRSMLAPAGWGVLYPDQRGAATAGLAPTIVGRAMWEVKRGAWGMRRAASGTRGIVPNCSPARLTLCAAKRRKFAASGGGNAWERADSCPVLDRSLQNLQKLLVRKFHRIALHAAGPLGGGNDAGAFGHGQSGC